ncbi:hypothetical protein [Paenibacillus harenae]|uniref:hypothetical protein n=1 Tax=Paenibacillus harenae TaxID=306543 RepID=UPI0003FB95A7|nr:hypothetical protein [Paenibacillus harenae]
MTRLRSSIVTRCSLVVSPVDVWTRKLPVSSSLSVTLQDIHKKPIRKSDGTYLFLDLPAGSYVLEVTSPSFIPYRETVDTAKLEFLNPVVTVPLLPGPGYPFPAAATAISFLLYDEAGIPLTGAGVAAYADEESASRGRISQDKLEPGDSIASVGLLQGQTVAGESLLLRGQGKEELVCVAEVLPGGVLRFDRPVKESYRRGALLLPAVRTRSAQNGSVLLPFRGTLPPSFAVNAVVTSGSTRLTAKLTAQSGKVASAPSLTLQRENEGKK